jgi:hypothetical protein
VQLVIRSRTAIQPTRLRFGHLIAGFRSLLHQVALFRS